MLVLYDSPNFIAVIVLNFQAAGLYSHFGQYTINIQE